MHCHFLFLATKDVVDFPGVKENQNVAKIVGVQTKLQQMMLTNMFTG